VQEIWKKSGDPNDDQINGDDEVEQPWNEQDEDAGNERDDGLQMIDAEGHGISPDAKPTTENAAWRGRFRRHHDETRGGLPLRSKQWPAVLRGSALRAEHLKMTAGIRHPPKALSS
jgi:hypothetical protein